METAGLEGLGLDLGAGEVPEEEPIAVAESVSAEKLLEAVTQRVAGRLMGAKVEAEKQIARQKLKEERIDQFTDSIVERIFSSAKK